MRVEYDSTLDDYLYLQDRLIRKHVKTQKPSLYMTIMTILGVCMVTIVLAQNAFGRIALALLVGVFIGVVFVSRLVMPSKQKQRQIAITSRGTDGPQCFAIEIDSSSVKTWQGEYYGEFPVTQLESVQDSEEFIEMWTKLGGLIIVAKRAFGDASEATEFIAYVRLCASLIEPPPLRA